ncbi:hypothetical protein CspeluHIS016_0803810 [Cutaneotrichosporon spelunceum]|uniref:Tryptophan synthase beta chain-like PALP domain-containing protein n=1 Tax=Cutaneotrichosporon spelunceum TaxID=1672016 RepID=A0AAD3TZJ6_9TREE|nr:hypothetical protein CspeluHIS016_0803810 [Cutaneotrichosporon spelunceum]
MAIDTEAIAKVHAALFPGYGPTPARSLPALADELGCAAVYVKDESSRYGLPAFKVLGASWGMCSVLGERWGLDPWDIDGLRARAKTEKLTAFAATDGNHGRAVAHTARLLGLGAHIFVPSTVEQWSIDAIASEGCPVTPVDADYDGAVDAAHAASLALGDSGLFIQDTSMEGYTDIPLRIVHGYSTIASELASQLPSPPSAVVVPVGVGSLAHAIVSYYGAGGPQPARVLTAEPDAAPCLHASLAAGKLTSTPGQRFTIMPGLNCPSVSAMGWDDLRASIRPADALVVTDVEAGDAMRRLNELGCAVGPCGAATLAAARKAVFRPTDVVVLICTEGIPQK